MKPFRIWQGTASSYIDLVRNGKKPVDGTGKLLKRNIIEDVENLKGTAKYP